MFLKEINDKLIFLSSLTRLRYIFLSHSVLTKHGLPEKAGKLIPDEMSRKSKVLKFNCTTLKLGLAINFVSGCI